MEPTLRKTAVIYYSIVTGWKFHNELDWLYQEVIYQGSEVVGKPDTKYLFELNPGTV